MTIALSVLRESCWTVIGNTEHPEGSKARYKWTQFLSYEDRRKLDEMIRCDMATTVQRRTETGFELLGKLLPPHAWRDR